jgi:hypothetical protein
MTTQRLDIWGGKRSLKMSVPQPDARMLANLLRDTGMTVLVMLSEKYGLRRIPGLGKEQIVDRLLRHLSSGDQKRLEDELIVARFSQASIDDLLDIVLEKDAAHPASRPRLEEMSVGDATLVESGSRRWVYTMRGHDVLIDLNEHVLACDCAFFAFSSKRQMPCKHLVTALRLVPPVYSREVLVDLAVSRRFGGPGGGWYFESHRAA